MGMRWNQNTPEGFVRHRRNDPRALSREDPVYGIARHAG
jgi:hypothetical protein